MEKKAMYGLPFTGYAEDPGSGRCIPILGGKMMSNADWVRGCIKSREDHPELYSGREDLPAILSQQRALLKELEAKERAAEQQPEEMLEIVEIDPRRLVKL